MKKIEKCGKRKKRSQSTLVLFFIIFELTFTAITGPFMIYYGPFKNVKTTVVGAAMTTLTLQWLATSFLSDEKIKEIMKDQVVETIAQNNSDGVNVENKDDNSIERYDIKGTKYKGHVLVISDATRLKVGYSSKLGEEGQLTSDIAKNNNAIAAVNAGAFTDKAGDKKWTGTGANPTGIIMSNGKEIFNDIKNENEKTEVVAFTKSGNLLVGAHSIKEMKELEVMEAVSFGPALIVNGHKTINTGDGRQGIAPRTAIGQRKDGAIILLVIDGRQIGSLGANLREVQDILYDYGAYNATNLDGGSSSTLFYDDEIINNPSDSYGERSIPSIIYVESRQ
ncbi:phosphodiester glycosidase family protein [Clostridium sp. CM028]|uniref:phosphodiester glycosidase family protein n=1 Tax=unclassified Clostridium TaxID=2614128 RepID=UPI001C6F1C12|nr:MULTISPECIES: phosphodiester glycosidase family protein [unclassified Clostridium]MBW9144574.1 phosphodiester glycosidase family protein [Clostridium sp. CM027]MBW9147900.1 phosphodiester glycosidase family protein [Clostridium sp. CM028]UVE40665.1 phosphodiester glycosidase family protein [Clostridium sp. CM027]WLC61336.1 phosphodiester glycosidase family protein [Clostridium sp. CM028]